MFRSVEAEGMGGKGTSAAIIAMEKLTGTKVR
jgi:hypothetical protein